MAADQHKLECSILKTVLYSDLFDYPLTPDEITHYLIGVAGTIDQVCASLSAPSEPANRGSSTHDTLQGPYSLSAS